MDTPIYDDQRGVTVAQSPLTGHWIVECGHDRQGWRHPQDALTQAREWTDRRTWMFRSSEKTH